MPESWTTDTEKYEDLFDFSHLRDIDRSINGINDDIPGEVTGSMARWSLLYEVPFQYLVVHDDMLPAESVRFFHMDMDYVFALLDGAMSIGRKFGIDYKHDAAVIERVISCSCSESMSIRNNILGKPADEYTNAAMGANDFSHKEYTGFLMRSDLVKGWRGLEFKAFDSQNSALRILRLDQLSSDILIGIFGGTLEKLEVSQPPEGLHFGFSLKKAGGFEKKLRDLKTGKQSDDVYADVAMRDAEHRIIDFKKTADNIGNRLNLKEPSSSLVALEMIQNPFTGTIVNRRS